METTGTIFEIRRFAIHDGPGIRTAVFLKGCPLDCWWCHNPEGRSAGVETLELRSRRNGDARHEEPDRAVIGSEVTVAAVMDEVTRDEVFYRQSGGGVTFSGGEPLGQIEFLQALLRASKDRGLHTAVDTCGYAPAADFERIYSLTDLFLFDLKLMDTEMHRQYTAVSNDLILSNLALLADRGNKAVVRIPMVPDITDTSENLEAIAAFVGSLKSIRRISLLPYNKLGEDKTDRYRLPRRRLQLTPQTAEAMERKAAVFRPFGYEVHIGG
jgi:pyruvate formate lyase activating enzyme